MDHPSWLWNPLLICEMGSGSFEHGDTCCGITQKGDQCKNTVRKETLKSGRQKLDTLAERPFTVCNLQLKLRDIAADFLCTRWHRLRQADLVGQRWFEAAIRSQSQTRRSQPGGHRPLRSVRSTRRSTVDLDQPSQLRPRAMDGVVFTGSAISVPSQLVPSPQDRQVTPAMLREDQVTWSVSDEAPAELMIANDRAGPQILKLKRFTRRSPQSSIPRHERCYICHGEDESEPVTLHCGKCELVAHLNCMELWLGSWRPGFHTSCPHCLSDGAFVAKHQPRGANSLRTTRAAQTVSEEDDTSASTPLTTPRRTARRRLPDECDAIVPRRSARLAERAGPSATTQPLSPRRRSVRLSGSQ
ncbi:hypothetical protein N7494_005347 [Penicillium frequentans]|uniref:RING-type domain-containing protein n=1 Tax=Penicillium frequentans TaxID=3151616 RepID=A0AAD6GFC1_9EURO|nr:hypothetical protein N7494_005347 [Penicillium glabrum]